MVADYVVDTNVWVMVDKVQDIGQLSLTEIDCIDACRNWLRAFAENDDRLVVDASYRILREYRRAISQQGRARTLLDQFETQPRNRLLEIEITFDEDGYAVLPSVLLIHDEDDRKFVAVALGCTPRPPIINATDTDWTIDREMLDKGGIEIRELCPDYVQEKR
jgi:hypothetical protein